MTRSKLHLIVMLISIITVVLATNLAASTDEYSKALRLQQSINHPQLTRGPTDDPPPQPVIAVAEWEPATGVLINYPLFIPMHLVIEMAEDCQVWSVVEDEAQMQHALNDYIAAGVDTSHCSFLLAEGPTDPWTRDYGPWYIFNGDDELGIINNDYFWYAPGNVSTDVPQMLGDSLGIPVYSTGIRNEGGNYMTDGMGKVIVTEWLCMVNPLTPPETFPIIYEDYLGIETFILTGTPLAGLHIDMWAKYLDPGRIIVIDPLVPNQELENWVEYFRTLMSSYGRPYEVLRVPGVGYSNSLILNNKVLVPQFNWVTDSAALAAYQEAMPGYEVHGFYYWSFSSGDALHCRTHEMADRYMLRIVHVPIHDRENDGGDYYLEADIQAYSNEPLIGPPVIMWKVEGGTYSPVAMTFAGDDIYYGEIPQQPDNTDIYYYLGAEDGTGRVENHPYIGPGNPHHFHVGPDTEPPAVEFRPPATLIVPEWPYTFTTYALDNRWISSVTLEYSINGIPQDDVDMPLLEPYAVYYSGTTAGVIQPGDVIEVRVKALDTSMNQNTTYSPYYTIAVEAAPAVAVTLTPYNPPIQILANGGSFDFNVTIGNNDPSSQTFDAWIMVRLPDSTWYGPLLGPVGLTLASGGLIDRDRTQSVPASAPAGMYLYAAYVGDYPDVIWTEDQFDFEKLGVSDRSLAVGDWSNWGEDLMGAIAQDKTSIPTRFALYDAYPNPFNPTTVIRYQLSAVSLVNLSVYDIAGRKVAELVNGWRNAGSHEVTFDGSNLASGVYLYHLTAGNFTASSKMVLVK